MRVMVGRLQSGQIPIGSLVILFLMALMGSERLEPVLEQLALLLTLGLVLSIRPRQALMLLELDQLLILKWNDLG